MRLSERVLLLIYAGMLTILLTLIAIVAIGWVTPLDTFREYLRNPASRVVVFLISSLLAFIGFRTIMLTFYRSSDSQTITQETPQGKIKVALIAVENLVKKTVRQMKGIKDVKVVVRSADRKSIQMQIRIVTNSEVSVPNLSAEIQKSVKEYVYDVIGIETNEITVVIDNIGVDSKSRVE